MAYKLGYEIVFLNRDLQMHKTRGKEGGMHDLADHLSHIYYGLLGLLNWYNNSNCYKFPDINW